MADYLARIAAAGTRTSMQAKPPVSGPALLPGPPLSSMLYPAHVALIEEVPTLSDIPGTQVPLPDSSAVPMPPTTEAISHDVAPMKSYTSIKEEQPIAAPVPVISNTPTIPVEQESIHSQAQKPAASDAAPIILAPRALRHSASASQSDIAQLHDVKHVYQKGQPDAHRPPTVSTGTSQPSHIPPSSQEWINTTPTTSGTSLPQAPIEHSRRRSPPAATQIMQPQQWRPPEKTMPDQGNNERPTQEMQSHIPTSLMPAEQGPIPQVATPPIPIKKETLSQGSMPLIPTTRTTSRQVKLTIGRLDVQVNNHPPAPSPGRSIPAVNPPATDALEQHCLERFHLKI